MSAELDTIRTVRENITSLERSVAVLDSKRESAATAYAETLALAAKELGRETITFPELEAAILEQQKELEVAAQALLEQTNSIRAAIEEGSP